MGPEFAAPAGQVLAILAITTVLAAPQWLFSSVLYGISRHRIIAILRIVEGVVNLGLSILLVQLIGLPGVALGMAIPSIVIVVLVLPFFAARAIGLDLRRYHAEAYLRPLLAILPVAALALWMRAHWPAGGLVAFFGQVALLCLCYAPFAFALVLSASERRQVVQRLRLPAFLAGGSRA
jgi:O-antigen/teichoic acid export membrane protein